MAISRDIKVGAALLVFLILLVAVIHYIVTHNGLKYKWDENYSYDNDQPYGADMLYDMLGSYNENGNLELIDSETVTKFIKRKKIERDSLNLTTKSTYFIISNDFSFIKDSELDFVARDYETLYEFMEEGNTVMIVSSNLDEDLIEQINSNCKTEDYYYNSSLNESYLSTLKADFENEELKNRRGYSFFYEYGGIRQEHNFSYFGSNFCRDQNYEALGTIRPNKTNYIKIQVGEGQLLLHANPIFFSNRHLIREDGIEYASKVFSYIPDGDIYWDKHNKPVKIKKPAMEGNEDDTPFSYILKQRGFRWALYLTYFAVGLFLIFNLFRKQKQIPVLFQNKNTSLEFIKNVGTLYYDNKNNKKLAYKIMLHFMNEIRLKYFISDKKQEVVIEKLASKTKVEPNTIKAIFKAYEFIEKRSELSDDGLIKFYLKIEKFYKSIKK